MSEQSENLDDEIKVRVDTKLKIGFKKISTSYKKAADHQRQALVEYLQRRGIMDQVGNLIEGALNDAPSSENPPAAGGMISESPLGPKTSPGAGDQVLQDPQLYRPNKPKRATARKAESRPKPRPRRGPTPRRDTPAGSS